MSDDREETCFDVGMAGRCGEDCPVYQNGECEEPPEPYSLVCKDATGVDLTLAGRYVLISRDGDMVKVRTDGGEEVEFFKDRFEFDLPG